MKRRQELLEKSLLKCHKMIIKHKNLLDYLCHQKYYKLIDIDLFRHTNTSIPQQISFVEKLEEDGATMFFIAEKQKKTILNFSLDSLIVTE